MSFFAKLFGLNQKSATQEDVAVKATQELEPSNAVSFLELIKNRRSIYAIGNNLSQTNDEIEKLIQEAIRHSPSAFNSQSSRAVIYLDNHIKILGYCSRSFKKYYPS